ncbi:iron uptake transporter deferrochelatase/peroxidase subunit [Kribbia dieselivorans]|uniref:iron uptake transporter deferrochelatase/peroxidase subunit n=1 Tax=Kribbia dieselivorans TaxID=331526 RepID=UPI000837CE72|nr:iron uptake transporter deferrochelatase/peroxidase subunit [Kribbia dieselivorans]
MSGVSRRSMVGLGAGALLAGGLAATQGGSGPAAAGAFGTAGDGANPADLTYDFRGEHQAGIVTETQESLHLVALDVVTTDADALRDLLTAWTDAAERMTQGSEAVAGGVDGGGPYGVPKDTGEALDLAPHGLTITIGYGPDLFDDRFGLADRRPSGLRDLPPFAGDRLDPRRSGGDLCIQACANDPQVAVHAVRNLVRMGFGVVQVRWSQLGFGRTSATSTSQPTPRNLFGFKDGTANLKAEDPAALAEHVWIDPADLRSATARWAGGTYQVVRRIRMRIEIWDRTNLQEQELVFGRTKREGAPLGQAREFDAPDFHATALDGAAHIDARSHVRLAHADHLGGIKILRRGYNFTDGSDDLGHLDAGLLFIAFCRDAHGQFVPMQRALARADRLNEYIEHTGSAIFLCPPGLRGGEDWGRQLFG